jgi:hypothetical protein
MRNREWLLKPEPIQLAKVCVRIVKEELQIKLPLSHPDFLQMLNDYAEMLDNVTLQNSVLQLNTMAGANFNTEVSAKIVKHPSSPTQMNKTPNIADKINIDDTVNYHGKTYPRWSEGQEFTGLYRGQPHYKNSKTVTEVS